MYNQFKTFALMGALTVILVGLGGYLAPGSAGVFLVLALVMNLGAYFYSDRLVLSMYRARPLGASEAPHVHTMLEELSRRLGIPKPKLYWIPDPTPNAFATGRSPAHAAVAVTDGILGLLSPRELRAVLAHELGHVVNRDTLVCTIAAALAGAVTYMASSLRWAVFLGGARDRDEEGGGALGALLAAMVAPLAATLVQLAISRAREYGADETGAQLSNDPEALASALLRLEAGAHQVPSRLAEPATASLFIVNPLHGGLAGLFSTHPPTEARVARLRAMARG